MTSAARSRSGAEAPPLAGAEHQIASHDLLSGAVDVCVDRPVLSLDRPFTYDLPAELEAGVGSLVQVPFHGRAVRGWVLGPAAERPARVLPVKARVSSVRFFDEPMLALLRWVGERYVAPLASVIERAVPPRVVSEEVAGDGVPPLRRGRFAHVPPGAGAPGPPAARFARSTAPAPSAAPLLSSYRNGQVLLDMLDGRARPQSSLDPAGHAEGLCF
jgi:primosomal protein N'